MKTSEQEIQQIKQTKPKKKQFTALQQPKNQNEN